MSLHETETNTMQTHDLQPLCLKTTSATIPVKMSGTK